MKLVPLKPNGETVTFDHDNFYTIDEAASIWKVPTAFVEGIVSVHPEIVSSFRRFEYTENGIIRLREGFPKALIDQRCRIEFAHRVYIGLFPYIRKHKDREAK